MSLATLRERYRQIVSMPLTQLPFVEEHGYAGVLFEDTWVRILLIRRKDFSEYGCVEVEIQPCPNEKDQLSNERAISFVRSFMIHLQYMMKLIRSGFQLAIIEDACVWSLSKVFQRQLDDSVLDSIVPPC